MIHKFINRVGFIIGAAMPYILGLITGEDLPEELWHMCIHLVVISIGSYLYFEDKK